MMEKILKIDKLQLDTYCSNSDAPETLNISSLSLIKMLRHGKAGIPIEVMGLMLGKFINKIYIEVQDVFAMPQSGTGVSVEAIDPVFQTKMLEMFEQIGSLEIIVGWYHSHPGFGCWLSGVDVNTQQNFEFLDERAVAVVIDPVQSVRGKVVIEAFKLNRYIYFGNKEIKQVTSIYSMVNNPSLFREGHGLNKYYHSLRIGFKKNSIEEIALGTIFQKDCFSFIEKNQKKNLIRTNILEIIQKLIFSLKEVSYEESFLNKTSCFYLFEQFTEEFKKINQIIRMIIDKISINSLYDILINYI